jgi:putative transposase
VSYRYGRFYIYITFHRDVVPREPRAVMGVDLNFRNVTYTVVDLSGNLVSMCDTVQGVEERATST